MSNVYKSASVDQYTECKLWTVADGLPKTDAVYNTSGLSIKYQIGNAAIVSVTVAGSPAPASMSAGGSHADWGIYHVGNGWYKIGLADAVLATAGTRVRVWIELADCDSGPTDIYVGGYDGSAVALGASVAGDEMDLVDAPNTTAVTAIQDGLSTHSASDVWTSTTRTLSAFTFAVTVGTNSDKTGYALTSGERSTLAGVIDLALINTGDGADFIGALADAIAADWVQGDASPLAIVAALKADAQWSNLVTMQTNITSILEDTDDLQSNQGDWATATGFSTHNAAAVLAAFGTGSDLTSLVTATGFATPTNITSATGIVLSGVTHTGAIIPRVALVDTTTTNTDMVSGFATQASLDTKLSAERLAVLTSLAAMISTNVYTTASLANGPGGVSAEALAEAVFDTQLSDHTESGSAGAALSAAGLAGDPWITPLPGSYGAGTAGAIVGGLPRDTLAIDVTVLGAGEVGDPISLKQSSAISLSFTFLSEPEYDTILLGISDDSGRPLLKVSGSISGLVGTFNITSKDSSRLYEGLHNYDIFDVDGYDSESGEYAEAQLIVSVKHGVSVEPLFLQPLG